MEEPCAMVRMHGSVRGASNRPYSIGHLLRDKGKIVRSIRYITKCKKAYGIQGILT